MIAVERLQDDLGPFDKDAWILLRDDLGRQFDTDPSLRGDLAHVFLGIRALSNSLSFKALDAKMKKFDASLIKYSHISNGVALDNVLSYPNFIQRVSSKLGHKELYINLLFFVAYFGLSQEDDFLQEPIMQEIGGLKLMVAAVMSEIKKARASKGVGMHADNMTSVLSKIELSLRNARENRYNKKLTKDVLGGLLENGKFNDRSLWNDIFHVEPKDDAQVALEDCECLYFNCYRLSSLGGAPKIAKSFLVFQSPGTNRNHFAFKAFYRSRSGGLIRRSAGALVPLGGYAACLGTSLPMGSSLAVDYGHGYDRGFSGPKIFAFDVKSLQFKERLVPGVTMTMNENERTLLSHVFIAPSNKTHSDDADIGTFLVDDMRDEVEKHWVDSEEDSRLSIDNGKLWSILVEKLTAHQATNCVIGYQKSDIDNANVF